MTKLPSHYLPEKYKSKYISTEHLIELFKYIESQGTSAMNVALALDLIEREAISDYKQVQK